MGRLIKVIAVSNGVHGVCRLPSSVVDSLRNIYRSEKCCIQLQWKSKIKHFLWIGGVSSSSDSIEANLSNGDLNLSESYAEMSICRLADLPIAKEVYLKPVDEYDWIITSENSILIERTLLSKVSPILQTNEILKCEISGSITAYLKIIKTDITRNDSFVNEFAGVFRINTSSLLIIEPFIQEKDKINKKSTSNLSQKMHSISEYSYINPLRTLPNLFRSQDTNFDFESNREVSSLKNNLSIEDFEDSIDDSRNKICNNSDNNSLVTFVHPSYVNQAYELYIADSKNDSAAFSISNPLQDKFIAQVTVTKDDKSCKSLVVRVETNDRIRIDHISLPISIRKALNISDYERVFLKALVDNQSLNIPPAEIVMVPLRSIQSKADSNTIEDANLIKSALIQYFEDHYNDLVLCSGLNIPLSISENCKEGIGSEKKDKEFSLQFKFPVQYPKKINR